ncbi:hypothetical protein F2Q69_00029382 [Brassica cretica]|uniref:Uncharacterized protein n=1 Tax=Brassica cretica TaxID=69181 RepID=A0A8S9RWT7_BRACR|nr:hypothetical protein F2Q69_00029382 [Brassica cretica]
MFGLKYRSTSGGRYRSMEECLRSTVVSDYWSTRLVSGSMVVDENNDDLVLLSINEECLPLQIVRSKLVGSYENRS